MINCALIFFLDISEPAYCIVGELAGRGSVALAVGVNDRQTWNKVMPYNRVQMEQQKKMLPGGHRLLSKYFQSYVRKQRYAKATDELLCSNLLSWFSRQARDEYHGNPPYIIVIRRISW